MKNILFLLLACASLILLTSCNTLEPISFHDVNKALNQDLIVKISQQDKLKHPETFQLIITHNNEDKYSIIAVHPLKGMLFRYSIEYRKKDDKLIYDKGELKKSFSWELNIAPTIIIHDILSTCDFNRHKKCKISNNKYSAIISQI